MRILDVPDLAPTGRLFSTISHVFPPLGHNSAIISNLSTEDLEWLADYHGGIAQQFLYAAAMISTPKSNTSI